MVKIRRGLVKERADILLEEANNQTGAIQVRLLSRHEDELSWHKLVSGGVSYMTGRQNLTKAEYEIAEREFVNVIEYLLDVGYINPSSGIYVPLEKE